MRRGERVGTFAWNSQRHFECYLAIPCIGAVLHTINLRLFPEQIAYVINHAEDRIVFVDDSLAPLLAPLAPALEGVEHFVVMGDGPTGDLPRVLRYEELLAAAGEGVPEYPPLDEREAAALCYTSGTTGNPKGVLYSHRSTTLHAAGVLMSRLARGRLRRPDPARRADVPRQRVGAAVRGGARWIDARPARAPPRRPSRWPG